MRSIERSEHPLQAMPGFDIRPYLPHALAATLAVFGLPAAFVLGMIMLPTPDPSVIVTSGLSVGLSTAASIVGNSIWMKNPASTNVSFGDLMIWGWVRRRRAEGKLDRGTRMLGLDRRGQPTRTEQGEITREQQLKVLHELNDALEAKDPYTRGHSERVERHVYRTAAAMGLSVHDLQELRMAAALHDIGKIRVPDRIIRKPGKLTDEERSIMEEHSAVGSWMLSHVASADVIEAVRHHHERWDGKGYPDGLAGTDIPLYARIIAVCDTFDAITSTRPYRAKSERERAIEVLKQESGTQFDPMAVDVFLKSLPTKVPVTAMLLMLPGAGRVLREVGRALKRAGASSLAGATTAASASVIIGAATVAPALDRIPVRVPEPVAASATAPVDLSDGSTLTGAAGPATPERIARANAAAKARLADLDADFERSTFDADMGEPSPEPSPEASPESPVLAADETSDPEVTTGADNSQAGVDHGKADEDHGKAGENGNGADKGKAGDDHGKAGGDHGKAGGDNGKPDKPGKPGKPDEGTAPGNDDPVTEEPGNSGEHGPPDTGTPGNGNGNGGENGNGGGNGNGNGGGNGNAGGNGNGNGGSQGNSGDAPGNGQGGTD